MDVWTYVITSDTGGAPNFEPPCATLTVCKPRIRRRAQPGELVLAFNGATLHPEPHSVCWAGIVSEVIPLEKYWADPRFESKKPGQPRGFPDNIYRYSKSGFEQIPNKTHQPTDMARDIGGLNSLIFGSWWYFGPTAPILPEKFGLRMRGARRGERHIMIDKLTWHKLKRWLDDANPHIPLAKILIDGSTRCPTKGARPIGQTSERPVRRNATRRACNG